MFEESSSGCEKTPKEEKSIPEGFRQRYHIVNKKDAALGKDAADIIADAFNPIKCTSWKIKNLLEQIEEDHPTHKSTEYKIVEKASTIPPIGKGIPERSKSKYMSLPHVKAESGEVSEELSSETKRSQFFEEIQTFVRKRNISVVHSNVICAVSKDQEGSRFIQKKLDVASSEEIDFTFQEIKKHIGELITDLFGNYVIQKFLEIGTLAQKKEILDAMEDSVIPLALHMYGCRVVQKALECKEINKKVVEKIQGHVIDLVCDQNGNHVIQKCVECVDSAFIIKEFEEDAVNLSKHRYGCRVIQRIFENSSECFAAINKIISNAKSLVEDQYGNYVIQHILERGSEDHKKKIIASLSDKIAEYSTHKFASNVMEKCVICGKPEDRKYMLSKLMSCSSAENTLVRISCDKFGNYVVQRMIDVLNGKEKEDLVAYLREHMHELKKSSYAKCILGRIA
ncbi:pumilio RNA-binding family [Nematocida sp. AWRm77]|nr:pumilio RNA-binding family [Nematocida sp. AWRm77]